MINNILSICLILFISLSGNVKEKNVSIKRNYALILNIHEEKKKNFVDADYVHYYVGDKAIKEAKKRGEADRHIKNGKTVYSVPGDIYIVNDLQKIRTLEVSDHVKLDLVDSNDPKNVKMLNTFDDFKKDFKDKLFLLTLENEKIV